MAFWLFKTEPDVFGWQHLAACPGQTEPWDGVRNYQARNLLRDAIQLGDQGFFYHSNCAKPGIVGIVDIVRTGYPDATAWDPASKYHDPKSTPEQPRWYRVDVRLQRPLRRLVSLAELKNHATDHRLADFSLLRKGNRLSVMPVPETAWQLILELETASFP